MNAISIITAAGLGLRIKEYSFTKYGRYVDKPLVEFKGKSLLEWSIKPLYPLITNGIIEFSDIYIVIRKDQDIEAFKKECAKINKMINIICIDKLSKGPAHTAFEALNKISLRRNIEEKSIIISDSDHTFRCDSLLREFRKNKRFNAFCTLQDVPNPDKWGYVLKNDNGGFSSGEKNILDKSKANFKKANFLIGCYIYRDFETLKKGIQEYELNQGHLVESHHSHILSTLSKTIEVLNVRANWGIGLGTPEQLEEADHSLISFKGNREPPTYIIDIDGVILEHDNGRFSSNGQFSSNLKPIKENIKRINKLYESGAVIILCSSRPKSLLNKTKIDLKKISLNYSEIVLGATSGQRFLINDRKPSNESLDTAISITSKRNAPFKSLTSDIIDFYKDCSKGSGARTAILYDKTKDFRFVRKWVYSENKNVVETLYKQFSYLKILSNYIKESLPEIINWEFKPGGISFYDMSFLKGKLVNQNLIISDSKKMNQLYNILSDLYNKSLYSKVGENFNELSKDIVIKKLVPTLHNIFSDLTQILDIYKPFLSENLKSKIISLLKNLSKNNELWSNHKLSLIHGDLTIENILFDSDNSIYLIDPLGSTMDIRKNGSMDQYTSPIFDLGKVMQSTISNYENWAYLDINSIDLFIRNFSLEEEFNQIDDNLEDLGSLFEFYSQYIQSNLKFDSLFATAQILIRVAPYRIRANYHHSALLCVLKSYAILSYLDNL